MPSIPVFFGLPLWCWIIIAIVILVIAASYIIRVEEEQNAEEHVEEDYDEYIIFKNNFQF